MGLDNAVRARQVGDVGQRRPDVALDRSPGGIAVAGLQRADDLAQPVVLQRANVVRVEKAQTGAGLQPERFDDGEQEWHVRRAVERELKRRQLGDVGCDAAALAGRGELERELAQSGDLLRERKSTRLNSSHYFASRMPSSALKKK